MTDAFSETHATFTATVPLTLYDEGRSILSVPGCTSLTMLSAVFADET